MIETRAIILDIQETKKKIENLGAIFQGDYVYKDIILVSNDENNDLCDGYLRLRVYMKNNWATKNCILVRKQAKSFNADINKKFILKKEFDSENEALNFVNEEFSGEFQRGFEYSRQGWQYQLENNHIYIEQVEDLKPMIEVEAESEEKLNLLFNKIGIVEKLTESMPEIMRRKK
jgi:hypothetical protein